LGSGNALANGGPLGYAPHSSNLTALDKFQPLTFLSHFLFLDYGLAISSCSYLPGLIYCKLFTCYTLSRYFVALAVFFYVSTSHSGSITYAVMVSLGEMISYLPIPGGHIKLAERFVNPAFSFVMGWNYWYNWYVFPFILFSRIRHICVTATVGMPPAAGHQPDQSSCLIAHDRCNFFLY
jgi:hypothetical protein